MTIWTIPILLHAQAPLIWVYELKGPGKEAYSALHEWLTHSFPLPCQTVKDSVKGNLPWAGLDYQLPWEL